MVFGLFFLELFIYSELTLSARAGFLASILEPHLNLRLRAPYQRSYIFYMSCSRFCNIPPVTYLRVAFRPSPSLH